MKTPKGCMGKYNCKIMVTRLGGTMMGWPDGEPDPNTYLWRMNCETCGETWWDNCQEWLGSGFQRPSKEVE